MIREVILTKDGSHTIHIPGMNVTYHSVNGAIRESTHVFIDSGLKFCKGGADRPGSITILEAGFGTGLNALLTLISTENSGQKVHYYTLELHPLTEEEFKSLNYCEQLNQHRLKTFFEKLHGCDWEKDIPLTPLFTIHKALQSILHFSMKGPFDLVYFDAFAPASQPELWTKNVFDSLIQVMSSGALLVTYCSKGDVRRAMLAAGFKVEKLPGPPGKREILRAIKP